jgi:hypothetical protein
MLPQMTAEAMILALAIMVFPLPAARGRLIFSVRQYIMKIPIQKTNLSNLVDEKFYGRTCA